jgi:hypothetical protein
VRDGGGPAVGHDAIRDAIAAVMAAFPELVVEVLAAGYASDRRLWTEWRLTGTRALTAGGGRVTVDGVSVFRLSNAGFREERLYWDSASARAPAASEPSRRARSRSPNEGSWRRHTLPPGG